MNRSIVGATARQLAELEALFPHGGQPQETIQPGRARRIASHWHDNRQIVRGPTPRHEMVGAYVEQDGTTDDEWKELGLPFSGVAGVSIASGATADFELKPNRLFLPGVLSIDDALAANLLMVTLTIGGRNCMLSSGVIPMRAFSHLTLHKPFKGWSASNAQPITFTLKNIHASIAQVVYGVWWGLAQDA